MTIWIVFFYSDSFSFASGLAQCSMSTCLFSGRLRCFICKAAVAKSGTELKSHFLYIHGIKNLTQHPVTCYQDGCSLQFHSFNRLNSHISRHHQGHQGSNDETVPCLDSFPEVTPVDLIEEISNEPSIEPNTEDLEKDPLYVFVKTIKDLVMSIKADPRNSVSHFDDTIKACKATFDATVKCLLQQFKSSYENGQSFAEIEKIFEISAPFITKEKDLVAEFKTFYNLNESKDIVLGRRVDNSYDGVNLKKKVTVETLQYVSVVETLKNIFNNPKARDLIAEEKQSTDNVIRNFKDGINYKSSEYFQQYPEAIRKSSWK